MNAVVADFVATAGGFTVEAAFSAGQGITALVGRSGSGKSVTLATIAGLIRPSRGTVVLHGRTVADAEARVHVATQDRAIGMVFQDARLLPHRSPLDNVAIAARHHTGRGARRSAAMEVLRRLGAQHLAHASTSTLSGGERQRVAFARALVGRPRLLLLDEPFSALDGAARRDCRRLLREAVTAERIPTLLVTHDLDEAIELADHVVVFATGRTVGQHPRPASVSRLALLLPTDPEPGASPGSSLRCAGSYDSRPVAS